MCGRYTLRKSDIDLAAQKTIVHSRMNPRYNIAPSQHVPVFRVNAEGQLEDRTIHWGLIPFWAKESKPSYSMINARAETVRTNPAYRGPFKKRRCVIPVDRWYEWQQQKTGPKRPHFFHLPNDELFFFASLWDHWESDNNKTSLESCTIITTDANPIVQPIHHRRFVILAPHDYDAWLDTTNENSTQLEHLLTSPSIGDLQSFPVGLVVNNARSEGPQCVPPP